jgi:hypothetical protein
MCSKWSMVCLDGDILLLILHYDINLLIHMVDTSSSDGDFELSYTFFRQILHPGQPFGDSMIPCMGDSGILVPKYGPTNP